MWNAEHTCLPEKFFTIRIRRPEWKLYFHRLMFGTSGPRTRSDKNDPTINIGWIGKMHKLMEARKLTLVDIPATVSGVFTYMT